jgi:hypothetical protein
MKILKNVGFYSNASNSLKPLTLTFSFDHNPTSIIVDVNEYEEHHSILNEKLSQKFDSILKSKVYLGKLSDLPRHKIKDYFLKNNIQKTSKLEQSETIILNKNHLIEFKKLFNDNLPSYWAFQKLDTFIISDLESKKYINDNFYQPYQSNLTSFSKIVNDNNYSFSISISDQDTLNVLPSKLQKFLSDKECKSLYVKNLHRENSLIEVVNILNYLKSNPNVKLIFDEDFLLTLNEDGFELDEEYLNILDSMFTSESQDNINLALEMISNINIEKHSLVIALFLNKHNNIFSWGSGLSLKHNKSFKSIIKYFESKNINFAYTDWQSFSINLYKLHKDDPEAIKIIQDFTKQNVNKYLKSNFGSNESYIELNNVDFKFNI